MRRGALLGGGARPGSLAPRLPKLAHGRRRRATASSTPLEFWGGRWAAAGRAAGDGGPRKIPARTAAATEAAPRATEKAVSRGGC